jgi:hypothetical protein
MDENKLWTPEKKLSSLPSFPRELFIQEGKSLYHELLVNKLEVKLCPAPIKKHADHKIRVVENNNPDWYSSVYHSHNRGRRKSFEKSLWRIANRLDQDFRSSDNSYAYDTAFRGVIYQRFVHGYLMEDGSRVFPDNAVRAFFNLEKIELDEGIETGYEIYQDVTPF